MSDSEYVTCSEPSALPPPASLSFLGPANQVILLVTADGKVEWFGKQTEAACQI